MRPLIDYYFVTCAHENCTTIGQHSIGPVLVPSREGEEVTKWLIGSELARHIERRRARMAALKAIRLSLKRAGQLSQSTMLEGQTAVQRLKAATRAGFYEICAVRSGRIGKPQPVLATQ